MREATNDYLERLPDEDPDLGKELAGLEGEAREHLEIIVDRFDRSNSGHLGGAERRDLSRIFTMIKDIDTPSLHQLNQILDYLDLNRNAAMDRNEIKLTLDILEQFSKINPDRRALSLKELQMLYAILRHLDTNHNGRLDRDERRGLRAALDEPLAFFTRQRAENPLLREVTGDP